MLAAFDDDLPTGDGRHVALSCSNYANVFRIWDILFGTYEHPGEQPHFEYGIEEDTIPSDILGQTLAPFGEWLSVWRQGRTRSAIPEPLS